jgi:DNA-binding CsgD family transcriptional regulator
MVQRRNIDNLLPLQFNENCSPFMDTLCEPLLKNFGITHCGYIRILEDGKMLRIANNELWTRIYFQHGFYNDMDVYDMTDLPLNEQRFILLTGVPKNNHCKLICSDFDIWNFLLVYEKFPTYGEFWFFGTKRDNTQILDFYINNLYVFQHFILYFKNKACHLLDVSDPSRLITTTLRPFKEGFKEREVIQNFVNEITYKRLYLNGQYSGKFLSRKESECLFYFSKGNTMKEIAEHTCLSPRTIETHLKNIKNKVGCHTKSELISLFFKT